MVRKISTSFLSASSKIGVIAAFFQFFGYLRRGLKFFELMRRLAVIPYLFPVEDGWKTISAS